MNDSLRERKDKMIKEQLEDRGITDRRVIRAFRNVAREFFVPMEISAGAYSDHPLPIGEGQTISQPYMTALMTQLLGLTGTEKVLEIGTGSGFQTAVLAELSSQVFSVERIAGLSERAKELLDKVGYMNVHCKLGDGCLGWAEESPFDRIIVTAAAESIPGALLEQLALGGLMIVPLGGSFSQILTVLKKTADGIETSQICSCVFVPLIIGQ